jgi:competence protein ComEC
MLFILMVGYEASAIRASIMGVIALIARETGESFNVRNAITFTALAMTLFNPTILTGDLSFMISFLAVLGIIYLGPPFKKLFRYEEEGLFGWKEAGITTLSAQLATMPILMNAFGQFSLVAIPANIFTLSLLPLTMFCGFTLACVDLVSANIAFFTAKFLGLILGYQLAVIKLFARIAAPLPLPLGTPFAIALYYLGLVLFIFSYAEHTQKI